MLRGLGLDQNRMMTLGLANCYIGDEDYFGDSDRKVFLLFQASLSEQPHIGQFIKDNKDIIVDVYDPGLGITMLVAVFPEKYAADWDKFMSGSYSKLSANYKSLFKTHGTGLEWKYIKGGQSLGYKIVHKTPDFRREQESLIGMDLDNGMEVWSSLDMKKEVFSYDRYLEQLNSI